MKSVLFLIPTLDRGGAENVLVDLVNNMDQSKFRITVQTLFDKDSQKDKLRDGIEYKSFLYKQFRGNSRLQALIPAGLLYRMIVGKRYDIAVSFLEGPTTHILSGCPYRDTKKAAWIHVEMDKPQQMYVGFDSQKAADAGYLSFDKLVFVARTVRRRFEETAGHTFENGCVLYNALNSDRIRTAAKEPVSDDFFGAGRVNMITVGRLIHAKGYDRLVRIQKKLIENGYDCHLYILGAGSEKANLETFLEENGLTDHVTLVGFQDNPYKYLARADMFVCSSRREGFSTAVSEALLLGLPVVSTNCSGAYELLGENGEYGIVTENDEESLFRGIRHLLDDPALMARYREKARERGALFNIEKTVKAVEDMLESL